MYIELQRTFPSYVINMYFGFLQITDGPACLFSTSVIDVFQFIFLLAASSTDTTAQNYS